MDIPLKADLAKGEPHQEALWSGGLGLRHIQNLKKRPLVMLYQMLQIRPMRLVALSLAFIFKTSPVLIFPLFVEHLLEVLKNPGTNHLALLWWPALGLLSLQLLNIPGHVLYIDMLSRHLRNFERNLRSVLIRRLQYLSIRFHHERQSGELQAKILRDVEQVELLVRNLGTKSFEVVLAILFAIGVTIQRDPRMLIFYAVATPLAMLITRRFKKVLKESNRNFRVELETMSSSVSEMIDMIPVTKAHGLEHHEIHKMEGCLNNIKEKGRKLDRTNALFESSSFMTLQITQLLCLMVTGTMCSYGWIGIPELVLYQALFALIVQSVSHILGMVPQLSKGLESVGSLCEILQVETEDLNDDKVKLKRIDGKIEFDGVSFSYGEGWAVQDVSLQVWPGECVAFVGESGSGKSTLMNLLIGFFEPQGGTIRLENCDQKTLHLQHWRQSLAVVPQNVLLFSGTLRDNICYGLDGVDEDRLQEVIRGAQLAGVVEKLPMGLETPIGENGVKLSGGQRQRIAIARALIRDPKVIILDEATSALDVVSEREVQKAIDHLVQGRTTFIVAHRLSTIRQAHRVVVMKEGRVIEMGTQEELMAKDGAFSKLKALQ